MPELKFPSGKLIAAIFTLAILLAATFLLLKITDKRSVIDGRNIFTSMEITLPGNLTHTVTSATQGNPFIIMFFDADCYYCHLETEAIIDNIENLDGADIYMVTTNAPEEITEFEKLYNLAEYQQIAVGRVSDEIIYGDFGIRVAPSLLIYDENGQLLFSNSGYSPINEILEVLGKEY